jgi:hypothetical protein
VRPERKLRIAGLIRADGAIRSEPPSHARIGMHARWLVGQWSIERLAVGRREAKQCSLKLAPQSRNALVGLLAQRCHHVADDLAQLSDLSAQVGKLAVEFISLGEKRIELLELDEICRSSAGGIAREMKPNRRSLSWAILAR